MVVHMDKKWSIELKKGSLQLCIVSFLSRGESYGYKIIKALKEESNDYFDLKEGTLYGALKKLEKKGYLESKRVWEKGEHSRVYYFVTDKGMKYLKEGIEEWRRMVGGTENILVGGNK